MNRNHHQASRTPLACNRLFTAMCFYNDNYDWYASICDVADGPSDKPSKCYECGESIQSGEFRRHIFQQQHEECRRCEWEELGDDEEPCEHHDYGETFDCDLCESCVKVLRAIEAVEADEGCPPHARQPGYGELLDAIWEGDGKRYRDRAVSMFPELASCQWLADALRQ